ncbi:LysM peptidoglycan-binding domain-containing protein [Actinoallomurus iriomotensis]|uniref:LysM domain-containing protein n=1 Tax=Actinoallomurus iriomotensis TaxID=478107 RepID=A0A9W6RD74_9ACTN|nr:hypothetical protein [Actinoallomurus iriomotensis]GLY73646.1 hypothetical protein Airi01_019130 [Actinoallomurus iriomotensis]
MTPPTLPPDPPTHVTVTPWDTPHSTLSGIAEDLYEDSTKWRDIYAANRDLIGDDPGGLRIGMQLALPPMEFYPGHVRSVAGVLDQEGGAIGTKLADAMRRLDAIGNFWGGDDLGTKFYKGAEGHSGYETGTGRALDGVVAFADFYHNVAGGLRAMADRHDDFEWENTVRVLETALKAAEK